MRKQTLFVLGAAAAVPLIAFLDGHFMTGTQAYYWHYLVTCAAEVFCLAAGYALGRSVKT